MRSIVRSIIQLDIKKNKKNKNPSGLLLSGPGFQTPAKLASNWLESWLLIG
jgi:hypothetical protein